MLPRFQEPAKIFRDPRFSWYHSPPLTLWMKGIVIQKLCQYWDGETVFLMKLSSAVKLLFGKGQINIATSSEGG